MIKSSLIKEIMSLNQNEKMILNFLPHTVFLTQIISRQRKNAYAKNALSISCWQKWNLR